MAGQCEELKMANFIDKSLNSFTFKPKIWAYFISKKHIRVQEMLYKCFIELIWVFADRYDEKQWDDDMGFNLYANAKRVQDALITAGYAKREE